jgi:Peptidase family S41
MRFVLAAAAALALAIVTFMLAASIAFAAEPAPSASPREVAADVAKAVDENFFDPARARTIAEGLRANAGRGEYDRFTNPLDLATALSSYLRPFDGHFVVVYRPNEDLPGAGRPRGPEPRPGPGPGVAPPPNPALARQNYGFVHTEMLAGGVGYIEVNQFAQVDARSAADPARKAVDAALQTVAGARAIIIDLRSSRGGAPSMVAYLASYFVPAGANVFNTFYSRNGTGSEAPVADPAGPRRLDVPLYILVNGGTGSASESFPYTLQAAKRAVIVGEPTNGRANPGGFIRVAGGFAVFVSGGSPKNPITGKNWEGTGVVPDVAVASAEALDRAHDMALQRLITIVPPPDAAELRWLIADRQAPALRVDPAPYVGSYGVEASVTAANGTLILNQGRRATPLRPVGNDVFVSLLDPLIHAQFERQGGRITAVMLVTPSGPVARFTRAP